MFALVPQAQWPIEKLMPEWPLEKLLSQWPLEQRAANGATGRAVEASLEFIILRRFPGATNVVGTAVEAPAVGANGATGRTVSGTAVEAPAVSVPGC